MSFKDAAKLRDLISKIARREVTTLSPQPRRAEVVHIDRENSLAEVRFVGDEGTVRIAISPGLQPRFAEMDTTDSNVDVVLVGGTAGNYYLVDVLSSPSYSTKYEIVSEVVIPTTRPVSSPGVNVIGYSEGLIVQVGAPVPAGELVEYHISTDPAFVPIPGDAATKALAMTKDQIVTITQTPDGLPLVADQEYSVRAFAWNATDYAVAPGAVDTAKMDETRVAQIIAAEVAAQRVTAAEVVVGNSHWDGGGLFIVTTGGTISFPTDGSAASIAAALIAYSLTVTGTALFQGDATFQKKIVLGSGVLAPADAPSVVSGHPYVPPLIDSDTAAAGGPISIDHNFDNWYTLTDDGAGNWISVCRSRLSLYLARISKSTGVVDFPTVPLLTGGYMAWAVTRIGTTLYVLGYKPTTGFQVFPMHATTLAAQAGNFFVTTQSGTSTTDVTLITDGTNLFFANYYTAGGLGGISYSQYTPAGTYTRGWASVVGKGVPGAYSCWVGSADIGAQRWGQFVRTGTPEVRVWKADASNNAGLIDSSGDNWVPHVSSSTTTPGVYYDSADDRFYALDHVTGAVMFYGKTKTDQAARTVGYRLTDGAGATDSSPTKSHTQKKRTWIRVDLNPYPDTPAGLYGQALISTRIQTPYLPLTTSNRIAWIDQYDAAGVVAAPAVFTGAPLGDLRTSKEVAGVPVFQVKGDGPGKAGWVSWDSNGKDAPWIDFIPVTTGITKGNGNIRGKYKKNGSTIVVSIFMEGGTTTAFTAAPNFQLPFPSVAAPNNMRYIGTAFISKVGNPNWVIGSVNLNSGGDTPSIAWLNETLTGDMNQWSQTFVAGPDVVYASFTITYECAP